VRVSPRGRSGRSSNRRRFTWDVNIFATESIAPNAVETGVLLSQTELIDTFGVRPTITMIYGQLTAWLNDIAASELAYFTWGIRFIESDVVPSTSVESPNEDAVSTDWLHIQYGFLVIPAGGEYLEGVATDKQRFVINNPRKAQADEALVYTFENLTASTSPVNIQLSARVGILLP